HPNVKVFVTQGGLQSIEEAISNGVPMVGLPFFADQPVNVRILAEKGLAIEVDHHTMTKEDLKGAILEVATNIR
ncbi:UDP-glucuronosyltransferase 2A3, partial [Gonioctena quinquepunctata]